MDLFVSAQNSKPKVKWTFCLHKGVRPIFLQKPRLIPFHSGHSKQISSQSTTSFFRSINKEHFCTWWSFVHHRRHDSFINSSAFFDLRWVVDTMHHPVFLPLFHRSAGSVHHVGHGNIVKPSFRVWIMDFSTYETIKIFLSSTYTVLPESPVRGRAEILFFWNSTT